MSPLLKAIGIGIATAVLSLLLMWVISKAMNRPFLPRFPQRATPTPFQIRPTFPTAPASPP